MRLISVQTSPNLQIGEEARGLAVSSIWKLECSQLHLLHCLFHNNSLTCIKLFRCSFMGSSIQLGSTAIIIDSICSSGSKQHFATHEPAANIKIKRLIKSKKLIKFNRVLPICIVFSVAFTMTEFGLRLKTNSFKIIPGYFQKHKCISRPSFTGQ